MLGFPGSLTSVQIRIHLYGKNVDMRRSFDGLHSIVQSDFKKDVRLGDLFVFLNRRLDRVKLLYWDQDGMAIWMKRLEGGTFQRPLAANNNNGQIEIDATDLALLLSGIDFKSVKRRKRYSIDEHTRANLEHASS